MAAMTSVIPHNWPHQERVRSCSSSCACTTPRTSGFCLHPSLFELDADGVYQQVAHVEGDEEFAAVRPFPVTVVPARLLDGLRPRG